MVGVVEPNSQPQVEPIEVLPVVVLSKKFPARPSSIPEIRDFVRHCLADSPLTEEDNREVSQIVFRALLDAAGPTGNIQISFRIFPEHVEVDVLHSEAEKENEPTLKDLVQQNPPIRAIAEAEAGGLPSAPFAPLPTPVNGANGAGPANFADWMASALRREGLTQEAAARQLGVSVKTVSRWVGGETEPRLRDLRRIQERFGDLPLS